MSTTVLYLLVPPDIVNMLKPQQADQVYNNATHSAAKR